MRRQRAGRLRASRSAFWLLILCSLAVSGCGRDAGPSPQAPGSPGARLADPGMRAAFAVVALERDPVAAITPTQAAMILPWLRVLRDVRPDDAEAAQTIADEVFAVFTPEQRAALRRLQEENRDRRPPGQGGGPTGARDPSRLVEFRRGIIDRAIRVLEGKVPPS